MRRIFFLFLIVAGCDDGNSHNDDLSVIDNDLGGDASMCPEGTKCTVGGMKGLCKSGACSTCVDPTDDIACDSAYSEPTKHYICLAGTCAIGCRGSNDCAGQVCGLSTPNVCSPCATDSHCTMALGSGFICNTTSGECVTSQCTVPNEKCANALDICCAGGATNSCVAGDCCSNAECTGGKSCVNHTCTNCPAPTNNTLAVDPSESGGGPTGADVAGCRFPTITAAMNVASPAPTATTIKVYGTKTITGSAACTDATIECFPIAVKPGVTIVGASPVPTVHVTGGLTGLSISTGTATLSNLILDGADAVNQGQIGLLILASPSPSPAPSVDHFTAKNFALAGIQVSGGQLDVKAGTSCTGNQYGLQIKTTFGAATMSTAGDQISMSKNTGAGVYIQRGALVATGTAGVSGAGTVVFNENGVGLLNDQTSGGAGSQTVNVDGLAIWKNMTGISITAGTPIKIRNCYILGNTISGIDIDGTTVNDPTTAIDIGNAANGHNTLQDADPLKKNAGVGICSHLKGTIAAQGNIFSGHDCSVATPSYTLTFDSLCTGGKDYGIPTAAMGAVDPANCTP